MTQNITSDIVPSWSLDDQYVAYTGESGEVTLLEVETGKIRIITNNKSWSGLVSFVKESNLLIFQSVMSGVNQIYQIEINGSNLKRLTN